MSVEEFKGFRVQGLRSRGSPPSVRTRIAQRPPPDCRVKSSPYIEDSASASSACLSRLWARSSASMPSLRSRARSPRSPDLPADASSDAREARGCIASALATWWDALTQKLEARRSQTRWKRWRDARVEWQSCVHADELHNPCCLST